MQFSSKRFFRPVFVLTGIVLLLLTGLCSGSAGSDVPLSAILNGIKERYVNLPGITVPYERDILTGSMIMLGEKTGNDKASGEMSFKPPLFMLIQQEMPRSETITTDGVHLWWYVPDKKQVYKYPYSRLGKEMRLLSDIFRGLSDIGDSFDVIQPELGEEDEYHLKLIPNPPWQEIDHIDLSVEKEKFTILSVEIYNYMGSVTRFRLNNFTVRDNLKDEFFRFVVPDDVAVIEEN